MTVADVYDVLDRAAPFSCQENYDNSGLVIGNMNNEISGILVALDVTREIAEEARERGVQLIVTHHPPIFRAIKRIDTSSVPALLAAEGINVISAHTNFDSAVMNDVLCGVLDLIPQRPLHIENGVKCGYICECSPVCAADIAREIKSALNCNVVRYNDCGRKISTVAVCSGSGGDFLEDVIDSGCDAYITGDVKHNVFIDAHNAGVTVFDAGHFCTENIFCETVRHMLSEKLPDVECAVASSNRDILSYEV